MRHCRKHLTPLVLLVTLALAAAPGRASTDTLVILQYHFVSATTPRSTSLTPEEFETHLDILAERGFEVVDLPDALAALRDGRPLPERAAAITFDDGYVSVYEEAFPRLRARDLPFTVFVNPDPIDARSAIHADWPQLAEMQAAGGTIANHGSTHASLVRRDPRLPPETDAALDVRLSAEILQAEARIEAELGVRHQLFAYPYGEYDHRTRRWLDAHGFIGIGQHSGVVHGGSDMLALPRFPFSGTYADADAFTEKIEMGPLRVRSPETLPDPVRRADETHPVLTFKLDVYDARTAGIACYATGQGRMDVEVELVKPDEEDAGIRVRATPRAAIPLGRSRYNCTAPSRSGGWLWFSQPWLRLGPDGEAPI